MAVIEKGGLIFIPLVISVLLGVFNGEETKREPKNDIEIQMDNYEKYLDSCIIAKSQILGSKAIHRDSTAKVLTKVCNILKTEVKVLKVENKTLKTEVKELSNKKDTIVKIVEIRKGLFGKETVDTLN
jgi:hypothetical protein